MAASDPTTDVPTPTGTLQGVAAFSWDGANWQPSGRAGPSVATPTGVLRGVAAFNGGPSWQPSGLAQPGVATPTGTLDGVAVYTWTGDSWVPPGGTATPSTPHGALRGVAAFNWDGAAWQPASQAGPSVATPYGVLDGVAMFNWSGSAWAAVGAPSLSLDFMTPGALDSRITFTRASTATYTNYAGVMQTAAANAPRWDYNPSTLTLRGLLIEEARTNLWLQSGDASNAAWNPLGNISAAPTVTANQATAPDGTLTAARVAYPAVSAASARSLLYQSINATAAPYTFSMYLRGAVGGEQVYLGANSGGVFFNSGRLTLTAAWQRFSFTSTLSATSWVFDVGGDLQDSAQTSTSAQTVYAWGAQVEASTFASSYIPTAAASVTRATDVCVIPPANMAPWFTPPGGSWMAEFISFTLGNNSRVIGYPAASGITPMFTENVSDRISQFDGSIVMNTANGITLNAVSKAATTYTSGVATACANGGAVASGALTTGYATLATGGIGFLTTAVGSTTGENGNGYIRRVRYWPRVLSNAELQAVTT